MTENEITEARLLTDPNVHALLMAVAEKAGEKGAEKAVKDSFFLIGVDLEDAEDVDLFRSNMRKMRIANDNSRDAKREFFKGVGTVAAAVVVSILTSLGSVYVRFGGIAPH